MSFQRPILRAGESPVFDSEVPTNQSVGAVRRFDKFQVNDGESIASVTQRAYGVNTPEFRERIEAANPRLEGTINVPR